MKKYIFLLIPFLYLFAQLFQLDLSLGEDLGKHIQVGRIIVTTLSIPHTNLFSYAVPDYPILSHEWLSEVVFYLFSLSGLSSLLVLKMLLVLATFGIIFYLLQKKSSLFVSVPLSLIGISLLSTRLRVRPELFSYLFIALFFLFIDRYRQSKKTVYLWLLPVCELLWVNMHVFFILGIAMYVFFFVDEWVIRQNREKQLLWVGVALVGVTLLNPGFITGALLPFTIMHNYGTVIEENLPIFKVFTDVTGLSASLTIEFLLFELLAVVYLIIAGIRLKQKELFYTLSGVMGTVLGIYMVRNISLFTILALIPLCESLTNGARKLAADTGMDIYTRNTLKTTVLGAALLFAVFTINDLNNFHMLGFGYIANAEKAADFMAVNNIKGPIFNNDNLGEYLIYRLYPQERVFIDDRPEDYPPGFWDMFRQALADENTFQQLMNKYHFNAIVFGFPDATPNSKTFLVRMIHNPEWVPVYADGNVTILLRRNSDNAAVISKYEIHI